MDISSRAMCAAMTWTGAVPSVTTSGALLDAPAELRIPVISANQVTMWAALRRLGTRAVGPYQALTDPSAPAGPVVPGPAGPAVAGPVGPAVADMPGVSDGPVTEQQQEGWT
ncbi:hypothetical protein [Streptomyces rochei]